MRYSMAAATNLMYVLSYRSRHPLIVPHLTQHRAVRTRAHPHAPSPRTLAENSSFLPCRVRGSARKTLTASDTARWKSRQSFREGVYPCSRVEPTQYLVLIASSSDWLWPAVWMLPVDSVYGAWPASGEIDVSYPSLPCDHHPISRLFGWCGSFLALLLPLSVCPDHPYPLRSWRPGEITSTTGARV